MRGWLDRVPVAAWRGLIVVSACVLFAVAVSNTAYNVTTPATAPHQSILRKSYAVGAFALLGLFLQRANIARLPDIALAAVVGVFSYGIEIGQIVFDHSTENVVQHGFDVFSGFAGALLGIAASRSLRRGTSITAPGIANAVALIALLLVGYELSYGRYHGLLYRLGGS
jgi:hypothetical protein